MIFVPIGPIIDGQIRNKMVYFIWYYSINYLLSTSFNTYVSYEFQASTLDGGKMIDNPKKEKEKKTQFSLNSSTNNQKTLTDEELFAACGGLTAHK